MSETGATAQQVEAALDRIITRHWNEPYLDTMVRERHRADVERFARFLVPPGYQIVPAGAVVLTADEAATASYACSIAADAAYEPVERDEYGALAAKLSGGAS